MQGEKDLSQSILQGFSGLEFTFEVYCEYIPVYRELIDCVPEVDTSFQDFKLDTCIGCELICAAICHSMNWDFLRRVILKKTQEDEKWLIPNRIAEITEKDISALLAGYSKKERIKAAERSALLSDIGERLIHDGKSYEDLFFLDARLQDYEIIRDQITRFNAFSKDPAEKKFRLLIQNVSDYNQLESLSKYYEPTIDYHIIRIYIRRGVVRAHRKETLKFLLNEDIVHRESTIGSLRMICSESMKILSWATGIDIKTISRIEWWVARTICVNGKPDCFLENEDSSWVKKSFAKCPFFDICNARMGINDFLYLDEPKYGGISY